VTFVFYSLEPLLQPWQPQWKLRFLPCRWAFPARGGTGMILSQFQVPKASYNQAIRDKTSPVTIVSIPPLCR
jgi:hypothetical protein